MAFIELSHNRQTQTEEGITALEKLRGDQEMGASSLFISDVYMWR